MKLSSARVSTLALASACALLSACTSSEGGDAGAQPIASGTLTVLIGGDTVYYELRQPDGMQVPLNLDDAEAATWADSDDPIDWSSASGSPVEVFGVRNAEGGIDVDVMRPAEGVAQSSSALSAATGPRKWLVIPITFEGGPLLKDMQTIRNEVEAAKTHFTESSFGKMQMNYKIVDPVDVPLSGMFGQVEYKPDFCDSANIYAWVRDAKAGAQRAMDAEGRGEKVTEYHHVMLIQPLRFKSTNPREAVCPWSGLASVSDPSRLGALSWIQDLGSMVHELGHNLGLHHANSSTCKKDGRTVPMSNDCTRHEYGDPFDPLGHGGKKSHFNSIYKADLGWIPTSQIATAGGENTYTVASNMLRGNGLQLLRVQGAGDTVYHIDFSAYNNQNVAKNELFIRTVSSTPRKSLLLDMHPRERDAPGVAFQNAGLRVGESFQFFGTNTRLTFESISPEGAKVRISGAGGGSGGEPPPPVVGDALVAAHSRKCASIQGASTANRTPALQRGCTGARDQAWTFERVGTDASKVTVKNVNSGMCLDIRGKSTENGAVIQQYTCHGQSNQQWKPIANSDGTISLRSVHSDKCIDIQGASTAEDARLIQWSCGSGANQRFRRQN